MSLELFYTRNHRIFRAITTPNFWEYVSGAILYEEKLFQKHTNGTPFVDCLKSAGVIPGIRVDSGRAPLLGGNPDETWYCGFDGLLERYFLVLSEIQAAQPLPENTGALQKFQTLFHPQLSLLFGWCTTSNKGALKSENAS